MERFDIFCTLAKNLAALVISLCDQNAGEKNKFEPIVIKKKATVLFCKLSVDFHYRV